MILSLKRFVTDLSRKRHVCVAGITVTGLINFVRHGCLTIMDFTNTILFFPTSKLHSVLAFESLSSLCIVGNASSFWKGKALRHGYKVSKSGYKVSKVGYKVSKSGYKVSKSGYSLQARQNSEPKMPLSVYFRAKTHINSNSCLLETLRCL